MDKQYQISASELDSLRKDASVSDAIKELAQILSGRRDDLPHTYKVPPAMAHYLQQNDFGNEYYQQFNIGYGPTPLIVRLYFRQHKHVIEMQFQSADGSNLMLLELDWKDAISEKG